MCQPIFPVHGENGLAQCTNTEHRTSNIQLPMVHCLAWRKGEPFSARSNIQTFRLSLRDARCFLSLRERIKVRACFENGWRGRPAATPWSATRRPELPRATLRKGRPHWLELSLPFRPASRRTAQASGRCYPKLNFQTRPEGKRRERPAPLSDHSAKERHAAESFLELI